MTSPIARRLDRVEAAIVGKGSGRSILYVATPELAEAAWLAAKAAGAIPPLCIVTPGQSPEVRVGATIADMMREVAQDGGRIQDSRSPAKPDGSTVWYPPPR